MFAAGLARFEFSTRLQDIVEVLHLRSNAILDIVQPLYASLIESRLLRDDANELQYLTKHPLCKYGSCCSSIGKQSPTHRAQRSLPSPRRQKPFPWSVASILGLYGRIDWLLEAEPSQRLEPSLKHRPPCVLSKGAGQAREKYARKTQDCPFPSAGSLPQIIYLYGFGYA